MSVLPGSQSRPALPLSVLDLCPVPAGATPGQAIANSLDLARATEALGYTRYWLAEHHNTAMLACSVPELLIARIVAETRHLRVGAGGIMLPNHAPLHVAETFRVLEAMAPGRIDLGLGRAPGTDGRTAAALRRSLGTGTATGGEDDFPRQLAELLAFLEDDWPAGHPFASVQAAPTGAGMPLPWILGSSLYGGDLAAANGFGFGFAHHIQPEYAEEAMARYRRHFRPSRFAAKPHAILAVSAIIAATDDEAEALAATYDLAIVRIRRGEARLPLPSPAEARAYRYDADEELVRRHARGRLQVGSPETVVARLRALAAATQADELMVTSLVHDHAARVTSYRLLAGEWGLARA